MGEINKLYRLIYIDTNSVEIKILNRNNEVIGGYYLPVTKKEMNKFLKNIKKYGSEKAINELIFDKIFQDCIERN